ncbi:hypothetical protein ACMXYX_01090 [Neptuniibacter sp. QD72_48]|uniref:hypothetical protein n=1 Tax=Neptuniibacter sp. QD72_48 TaxID=3398214 RepID=UPI0039F52E19
MKKHIVLIVCLSTSLVSNAEPDSTARYLINEPLSMLEWGIYRIQKKLDEDRLFPHHSVSPSYKVVEYDWDRNEILIRANIYPSHEHVTEEGINSICQRVHSLLRASFHWHKSDDVRSWDGIASYFNHTGYVNTRRPKSFQRDIESNTAFKVTVYTNNPDEGIRGIHKKRLECFSGYLDKEIAYQHFD